MLIDSAWDRDSVEQETMGRVSACLSAVWTVNIIYRNPLFLFPVHSRFRAVWMYHKLVPKQNSSQTDFHLIS